MTAGTWITQPGKTDALKFALTERKKADRRSSWLKFTRFSNITKTPKSKTSVFSVVKLDKMRIVEENANHHGGGDSSVVRAPDSWLKGRGFKSLQERRENFLLQGRLSVLTLISVSVHPRVTAVARKRSRSFCQKCRWQVTAKNAYTLRKWLCMKWHGAWLYGVHRTCAETAAVSCGTSHASAVSTPLRWIFKNAL